MERRLAAIMAADVVGYSRLMGEDEAGTLARLKALHKKVVQPSIKGHKGRIVKLMGDGLLAEFPSVRNAVQCAVAIQSEVAAREPEVTGERRLWLRIGINLGDIIGQGADIFGDGVNMAARLEGLADPGGICLSRTVHGEVKNKLDLAFEDLGTRTVKNIAEPVRVFRIALDGPMAPRGAPEAAPAVPPDKPSIAVLPFTNLSGDPEQEYFSDGITEDIITALAKFHSFLVIARNSSFTYKGRAVDVKTVARSLGVRYVVEGSVRKAGTRVRVTAQLIDVGSGGHVWAERFDRELDDIFLVQDEITQSIAAAIGPEFESAEIQRASRSGRRDLTVWDLIMQARWHLGRYDKDGCLEAQALLARAIALDERNSQARGLLALSHWMQSIYRWSDSLERSSDRALEAARRAVSLDDGDASAHCALGIALTLHREHLQAIEVLSHAVRLNPNLASAHGWLGIAYTFACDFEPGVAAANRAMRLSPRDLDKPFWMAAISFKALADRNYQEVVEITATMLRDKPNLPTALRHRAAALGWLGRKDEARRVIDTLLRIAPDTTIAQVRRVFSLSDPEVEAHWLEGLRRAGLPE